MPNDERPPAFLFYPADFTSDGAVEAMTTEEVGAYILLLCKAWREEPAGSIPNDDRVLAKWARLTPDRWEGCKPAVLAAFTLGRDSRWQQKRLRQEFDKLMLVRKNRHKAAQTAANKRWEKPGDSCESHASRMRDGMPSDAISSSSSIEENNNGAVAILPEYANEVEQAHAEAAARPVVVGLPPPLPPPPPEHVAAVRAGLKGTIAVNRLSPMHVDQLIRETIGDPPELVAHFIGVADKAQPVRRGAAFVTYVTNCLANHAAERDQPAPARRSPYSKQQHPPRTSPNRKVAHE